MFWKGPAFEENKKSLRGNAVASELVLETGMFSRRKTVQWHRSLFLEKGPVSEKNRPCEAMQWHRSLFLQKEFVSEEKNIHARQCSGIGGCKNTHNNEISILHMKNNKTYWISAQQFKTYRNPAKQIKKY